MSVDARERPSDIDWNTAYNPAPNNIVRRWENEEENCMAGGELLDGGGPG